LSPWLSRVRQSTAMTGHTPVVRHACEVEFGSIQDLQKASGKNIDKPNCKGQRDYHAHRANVIHNRLLLQINAQTAKLL